MTELQLREVISIDFKALKEQFREHIELNPPKNPARNRPKKHDLLDFDEFKFIIQ